MNFYEVRPELQMGEIYASNDGRPFSVQSSNDYENVGNPTVIRKKETFKTKTKNKNQIIIRTRTMICIVFLLIALIVVGITIGGLTWFFVGKTGSSRNGSEVAQYTKLAVGLGRTDESLDDFEVIDLALSNRHCKNLPTFPFKNSKARGILVDGEIPLVCGGEFDSTVKDSCYTLKNNAWASAAPLNEKRSSFGMTRSPFADDLSSVFVVGGNYHQSSEVLKENHWVYSSKMPVGIAELCMVQPDQNSVMVIGGYQSSGTLNTTYTLNSQNKQWRAGPELSQQRSHLECAMIRMDSQSKEKSIIAIGGYFDQVWLDTTEVLDPGSSVWRKGPELPVPICCGAVVELPSGGIIYVAGFSWKWDRFIDKLLKLDNANAEWEVLQQRLKHPRHFNTAFLIPDEMADCN